MIFLLGGNEDEPDLADECQPTPAATGNASAKKGQKNSDYLNEEEHNELIFHDEHELESSAGSCSEDHEDCESDDSCYIAMKSHQRLPPSTKKIIKGRNLSTEDLDQHQHQQHNNNNKNQQQPFSSATTRRNHVAHNNKNKNTRIFEQQQQHNINSSILGSRHYLTIEDLRSTINSCWLCGCDWREEHVSLDCPECGGYSLSRPCPQCDGQCKQVWCRNLSATHDLHKAFWSGHCDLPAVGQELEQKLENCNHNNIKNDKDNQHHQNNNKLATKQQQAASRQHYAVFCNV